MYENRVLEVDGGVVRSKRIIVDREVTTEQFMRELQREITLRTDMLPRLSKNHPACIHMSRRMSGSNVLTSYIVERPPMMTPITFVQRVFRVGRHVLLDSSVDIQVERLGYVKHEIGGEYEFLPPVSDGWPEDGRDWDLAQTVPPGNRKPEEGLYYSLDDVPEDIPTSACAEIVRFKSPVTHTYTLSWPHTFWVFSFINGALHKLYLVAAKESADIQGLATPIFVMPAYNIHAKGQSEVCLGRDFALNTKASEAVRVYETYNYVLDSAWNTDLQVEWPSLLIEDRVCAGTYSGGNIGKLESPLEKWARLSALSSDFYKSLIMIPHRTRTLGQLLGELGG